MGISPKSSHYNDYTHSSQSVKKICRIFCLFFSFLICLICCFISPTTTQVTSVICDLYLHLSPRSNAPSAGTVLSTAFPSAKMSTIKSFYNNFFLILSRNTISSALLLIFGMINSFSVHFFILHLPTQE